MLANVIQEEIEINRCEFPTFEVAVMLGY